MKLLTEIRVKPNYSKKDIFDAISKKYHIFSHEIVDLEIIKESIDSRKKPNVFFSLNVAVNVKNSVLKKVSKLNDIVVDHSGLSYDKIDFKAKNPIVVGFGPSGMFSALVLAKAGLNPIVLEQGKNVDDRQKDIEKFWKTRKLNCFSNVQFGEGGAGTFSDGKLASNISNEYTKKCINEFILSGAPSEIFYSSTPHIGSDRLKDVVKNIREKIISLGGKVIFNTCFKDFKQINGKITKVFAEDVESGEKFEFETDSLVLAVGHSAKSVYELLNQKQLKLKPKPFAMGVRIEQSQNDINHSQYGKIDNDLPNANYKLVTHLNNGRSVFTFCMCPGG